MSKISKDQPATAEQLTAAFNEIISFIDGALPFQRRIIKQLEFAGMPLRDIATTAINHLDNPAINE